MGERQLYRVDLILFKKKATENWPTWHESMDCSNWLKALTQEIGFRDGMRLDPWGWRLQETKEITYSRSNNPPCGGGRVVPIERWFYENVKNAPRTHVNGIAYTETILPPSPDLVGGEIICSPFIHTDTNTRTCTITHQQQPQPTTHKTGSAINSFNRMIWF